MGEAAECLGGRSGPFVGGAPATKPTEVEDQRLGRAAARAVPIDEARQMVRLYESRYTGWTVQHFHERWQAEHGGTRSYTWTKNRLQRAGHVARAPRRGAPARSGPANRCRA